MDRTLFLKDEEIKDIFKNHLNVESKVMSIETLFANERRTRNTVYDPYYQRNYVWDNDKATYFIESILLGTEIPPLVFFNTGNRIEVIDGRQRFETIKRFKEGVFHLTKKGLSIFSELAKKSFDDFDIELQDVFWDTKLRIIEFSVVNDPKLDERKEDQIKKEIFRRYNSGITPLKNAEIEKAIYIHDDTTSFFKKQFSEKESEYLTFLDLFFLEKDKEDRNKSLTVETVMQKIRLLLVLHNLPIDYYSTLKGRKEVIQKLFENLSNNTDNVEELYLNFISKINILSNIKKNLVEKKISSNKLVFECLFWALTIIEQEKIDVHKAINDKTLKKIICFVNDNISLFQTENSHFYKEMKERYTGTALFFGETFGVNFDIYIRNNQSSKEMLKKIMNNNTTDTNKIIEEFESLRLNKPDASTTTIDDICRQMNRRRFLVRPPYQRGESINQMKSSAIIESILLGIKLPPIFIFKRPDGISEVVDGQQRLLSILGFIGVEFLDEKGDLVKSEKNNFKLNKLRILNDLNGKSNKELPGELKDKILDFNLSLVTIDSKINPQFDPIDLFIRLNNKPYPIRENTFEMWNSYIDNEIIKKIRTIADYYGSWFYSRMQNTRMENEELITTLSYFEYKLDNSSTNDYLDIYQRNDKINFRVKSKIEITKLLNSASQQEKTKEEFMKCITKVNSFVRKLKVLLIDKDVEKYLLDEYLKIELDKLFNLTNSKVARRTLQNFYALWYILSSMNYEMIKKHRIGMKNELTEIFGYTKNVPISEQKNGTGLTNYKKKVNDFIEKYQIDERKIILTFEEKKGILNKQNNLCPLCNSPLFISDEIEVDHAKALAIGGSDRFLNLQITHKDCNRKKGARF